MTLDLRFMLFGSKPSPRGVVIAAIDDETLRELGGYPLPRDAVAQIVRQLTAFDPQAIAIDILFLDPGNADASSSLADALRDGRSVVAAVGRFEAEPSRVRTQANQYAIPAPIQILDPIPSIAAAARTGLVNISTDQVGIPRFIPLIFRVDDAHFPSFALAAAAAALNTDPVFTPTGIMLAGRSLSVDLGYHLPIRYYGPRGSVRQFSAIRALRGTLNPDEVRGQVIVLGATAIGLGDTFATPFDRIVPGVEIWATGISNILAGDGLIRTNAERTIDASTAALGSALIIMLMGMRRTMLGLGLAALVVILWTVAVFVAFATGHWLSMAVPLGAILPIATSFGLVQLVRYRIAARRLQQETARLAKFQSPLVVDHIRNDPNFLARPVRQDAAIVFVDLSGFTGLTELLGPDFSRDLLAGFQALVERDVLEHRGYVVSFIGDGAMIVFGLPKASHDDAARGLTAIAKLRGSLRNWIDALPLIGKQRLSFRIGGHAGPVVLSRLGAAEHQHITATGDTVNIASRLLEMAKQRASSVIVSDELWNLAGAAAQESFREQQATSAYAVQIRGRSQPLRIRVF